MTGSPLPSESAAPPQPFHFCLAMRRLCEEIVAESPMFGFIEMDRIAIAFAQARSSRTHGLQAKLTPLRFPGGKLFQERGGTRWTVQRLFQGKREMLYILTFYLPRFQNQTFDEKLLTIFHEFYHVGPDFDGDLRRFPGRYAYHTHSEKEFERQMQPEVDHYLSRHADSDNLRFLRLRFNALQKQFGEVVGTIIPTPQIVKAAHP